jgi:hypothetical protein
MTKSSIPSERQSERYMIGAAGNGQRAVYFTRFDERLGDNAPSGIPIMFLRDMGMEKAAEEMIMLANAGAAA